MSEWRVESREAKAPRGSVNGKKVWHVVRDIQVTQPNGMTYTSLQFLGNGKSNRFASEEKALKACGDANKEAAE